MLGPAEDGGYYLIGLNTMITNIFEGIDWGTRKVYQQTTDVLKGMNIPFDKVDMLSDIDTLNDVMNVPELQEIVEELSVVYAKNNNN